MKRVHSDLIWNYVGLIIVAGAGALINLVVGHFYGTSGLGFFNQAYAVYVVAGQLAVLGLHLSALRSLSLSKRRARLILPSVLLPTVIVGFLTAGSVYLAAPFFASVLESSGLQSAVQTVAYALPFFAVNKVLLSSLNGLRAMKAFGFLQALRGALIAGAVLWFAWIGSEVDVLLWAFVLTEIVLLVPSFFLIVLRTTGRWSFELFQVRSHLLFGTRGFMSGFLLETNTRVDVLVLGIFLPDSAVGVYSFAAMLAEGFLQVLAVARNQISPRLAKLVERKKWSELRVFALKSRRTTQLGVGVLAVTSFALFSMVVDLLPIDTAFQAGRPIFGVLVFGLWSYGGYFIFDGILTQSGYPGTYTLLNLGIVGSNLVLNFALVPTYGLVGAAFATSVTYGISIIFLRGAIRYRVGLWI